MPTVSDEQLRLLVDEGDADSAADYARYIEQEIGFPVQGTLDDLLRFSGFDTVTALELETRSSRDLMASYPDRLLASRFFAPKISDVSGIGGPAASKDLGWRKLVRLTVPPNTPAATRGIAAAYLLFNVVQPRVEIGSDPFEPDRLSGAHRRSPRPHRVARTRCPRPVPDARPSATRRARRTPSRSAARAGDGRCRRR